MKPSVQQRLEMVMFVFRQFAVGARDVNTNDNLLYSGRCSSV